MADHDHTLNRVLKLEARLVDTEQALQDALQEIRDLRERSSPAPIAAETIGIAEKRDRRETTNSRTTTNTQSTAGMSLQTGARRETSVRNNAGDHQADDEAGEDELDERDGLMDELYTFTSMWDAAALLGFKTTWLGTLQVLFIFFLQLAISGVFIAIVILYFRQNPYDPGTIKDFAQWRTTVAHQWSHYNLETNSSLASRVCSGTAALELAQGQQGALTEISDYLDHNPYINGPAMCALAQVCWFCSIVKEFRAIWNYVLAFEHLPKGKHSIIERMGEGSFEIKCISYGRFAFILLLGFLRFAIAIVLLWCGTIWLTYTFSVADLLLNCVALQFVLDIDEFLLDTLAPIRAKNLLASITPLDLKIKGSFVAGVDLKAVVMFLFVILSSAISCYYYIGLAMSELKAARTQLCGGKLNFVSSVNAAGVLVYTTTAVIDGEPVSASPLYPGPGFSELAGLLPGRQGYDTYPFVAVRKVINSEMGSEANSNLAVSANGVWGQTFSMEEWTSQSPSTIGSTSNPQCENLLRRNGYRYFDRLVAEWFDGAKEGDIGCVNITEHCTADTQRGKQTRVICPEACGCDNPSLGLALSKPFYGCSAMCSLSETYAAIARAMPCQDIGPNFHQWRGFVSQIKYASNQWFNRKTWRSIVDNLAREGCDAVGPIKDDFLIDMCDEDLDSPWPFASLRTLCPVACGCTTDFVDLCPLDCDPNHSATGGWDALQTAYNQHHANYSTP